MLAAVVMTSTKPATTVFSMAVHAGIEGGVATIDFLDRLNIHTLDGYDVRSGDCWS
jgi:hypothetical protein